MNLCGDKLPWVDITGHLGHAVYSDGTMRQDIREKKAQFVDTAEKYAFQYSMHTLTDIYN